MCRFRIKGNYKIGSQEMLYCPVSMMKDSDLKGLSVKKVKVWYIEYYMISEVNVDESSPIILRSQIFMNHKYMREEAIKYLNLLYDMHVFYINRIYIL